MDAVRAYLLMLFLATEMGWETLRACGASPAMWLANRELVSGLLNKVTPSLPDWGELSFFPADPEARSMEKWTETSRLLLPRDLEILDGYITELRRMLLPTREELLSWVKDYDPNDVNAAVAGIADKLNLKE